MLKRGFYPIWQQSVWLQVQKSLTWSTQHSCTIHPEYFTCVANHRVLQPGKLHLENDVLQLKGTVATYIPLCSYWCLTSSQMVWLPQGNPHSIQNTSLLQRWYSPGFTKFCYFSRSFPGLRSFTPWKNVLLWLIKSNMWCCVLISIQYFVKWIQSLFSSLDFKSPVMFHFRILWIFHISDMKHKFHDFFWP